jgi:phosphoenolpyruvate synthase/pyruvate phosphate dikinase
LSYIQKLSAFTSPLHIGNKAYSLRFLQQNGFRIPETYVCGFSAFQQYREGTPYLFELLSLELDEILEEGREYAIRSSANLEDGPDSSFAGQF